MQNNTLNSTAFTKTQILNQANPVNATVEWFLTTEDSQETSDFLLFNCNNSIKNNGIAHGLCKKIPLQFISAKNQITFQLLDLPPPFAH